MGHTVWIKKNSINGLAQHFPLDFDLGEFDFEQPIILEPFASKIYDRVIAGYEEKESHEDPEYIKHLERNVMLSALDELWMNHLRSMDNLRQNVQFAESHKKIRSLNINSRLSSSLMSLKLTYQQIAFNMFRTLFPPSR